MKLMGVQYMLCRCKIGKFVMYYTLRPNFTPKCPVYYTLIVKRVNRSGVHVCKVILIYDLFEVIFVKKSVSLRIKA